jgi:hypothetical protein
MEIKPSAWMRKSAQEIRSPKETIFLPIDCWLFVKQVRATYMIKMLINDCGHLRYHTFDSCSFLSFSFSTPFNIPLRCVIVVKTCFANISSFVANETWFFSKVETREVRRMMLLFASSSARRRGAVSFGSA